MYIAASAIQTNYNPGSFYLTVTVISSGGTNTNVEVFADDTATAEAINAAIAEGARDACRANNESVDTNAPVMIFGSAIQVS